MAVTATPVFVQTPKITPAKFTNSDSANTKKTVATAGANGSKVVAVNVISSDTSDRTGQLWLTRSATSYLLTSTVVIAGSGNDGLISAMSLMQLGLIMLPTDNDGQAYLFLESGDTLQVSFTTQVTAAKEIHVVGIFADF